MDNASWTCYPHAHEPVAAAYLRLPGLAYTGMTADQVILYSITLTRFWSASTPGPTLPGFLSRTVPAATK